MPIEKLPSERDLSGKPAPDEILKSRQSSWNFKLKHSLLVTSDKTIMLEIPCLYDIGW